jgi:hypothetical protein
MKIDHLPEIVGMADFIKEAQTTYPMEQAAWVYTEHPYMSDELWHIIPLKTIGADFDNDGFDEGWKPDIQDKNRVTRLAKKEKWAKLGTIHTHPLGDEWAAHDFCDSTETAWAPSEMDLKYAQRFRDIVRMILVLDRGRQPTSLTVHDMFGNTICHVQGVFLEALLSKESSMQPRREPNARR